MLSLSYPMDGYTINEFPKTMIDTLKKSMTLDFKPEKGPGAGLLDSPDLKMMGITSPDLENMICQQGGLMNMPTPTPCGGAQLLRLMSLREDEKAELRGFDDALAKVQQQSAADTLQQFADADTYSAALRPVVTSQHQSVQQMGLVYSRAPAKRPFNDPIINVAAKRAAVAASAAAADSASSFCSEDESDEEDQSSGTGTHAYSQRSVPGPRSAAFKTRLPGHMQKSGAAPIDLGDQERLRVERKRERNRLAARKCRERKIRKIDELTLQVQKLEKEKGALSGKIVRMQTDISRLQNLIRDHQHSGCKLPLGH